MKQVRIQPLETPLHLSVDLPGSLTYTTRALNLAAMTKGVVRVENPLKSDDTYAMYNIIKDLGIDCLEEDNAFVISGDISQVQDKEYVLNSNISGRTTRTCLSLLCIVPGIKTLNCKEEFKKRPVGDLVDGLRQLGADIDYLEKEGHLPVRINSSELKAGKVSMNGEVSSQYFSSIMMIAPMLGEVEIEVIGEQTSKSYIDVTIEIMQDFGVEVVNNNYKSYLVKAGKQYQKSVYEVETDASTACYFFSIAALTGSTIRVNNIIPDQGHADKRFADILGLMGCKVNKNKEEKWIEVTGVEQLQGVSVDMNSLPDQAQTLAVIAAFANGSTSITGLDNLKYKETDRIAAPEAELHKMGIRTESDDTTLKIYGGEPHGAEIDTYGDHRMAMAFAPAGCKIDGMIINDPMVVSKSFPEFFAKLEEIGIKITEVQD